MPQRLVHALLVLWGAVVVGGGTGCSHGSTRHASRTPHTASTPSSTSKSQDIPSLVTDEGTWGTPELFERIVAVVDKDVVTFGELVAEARLALVERHGERFAVVTPEVGFLEDFVSFLVGQMLIAREARRMGSDDVTEEEIDARLTALRDNFSSLEAFGAFVASLEMDFSFVRDVLARNLRNERYTQQRLRTRMLGADLRRDAVDSAGKSVRPKALKEDRQDKKAQMLRAWLGDLRQAVDIQILGDDGLLHADTSR